MNNNTLSSDISKVSLDKSLDHQYIIILTQAICIYN